MAEKNDTEHRSVAFETENSTMNGVPDTVPWSAADEQRIRRKIDFRVMPIVFFLFLLCYIDRTNIGNARIQGLGDDLGLVGYQFNFALTVFYIAYIFIEIPSNIILKHVGARFYLPALVLAFGMISMCTALVHNYAGLIACRVFLGIAEGGVLPGIAFYLSSFYRRTELLFRISIFIMGASIAGAFGGLLAAGLTHIPRWGVSGVAIETWRNIFFFEGIISMLFVFVAMALLPASPATCRFLTPADRRIAQQRMIREFNEESSEKVRLKDIVKALTSVNANLMAFLFFFINITVGSFSLFLPSLLKALGWTSLKAQLLSVPPYVVACIWAIGTCYLSDKVQRRGYFVIFGSLVAVAGYAIQLTTTNVAAKYAGVFIACAGSFPIGPTTVGWGLNNAGGANCRSITSAYIVAIGNCGSVVATWAYLPADAPGYRTGHALNLAAMACTCVLASISTRYFKWENGKRASGTRDYRLLGLDEKGRQGLGLLHPEFRYIY